MKISKRIIKPLAVAIIFIICIISILHLSSPVLTVSEVVKNADKYEGTYVKVMGLVASKYNPEDQSFLLQDEDDPSYTIKVVYQGALPSGFSKVKRALVMGKLVSTYEIKADHIAMECPARY
jgi:cytochrome c-type biogenesis protein CcmE